MNSLNSLSYFFFNDTATTEIYTLSLHDALPISMSAAIHRTVCASISVAAGASVHAPTFGFTAAARSEEHTSELQSRRDLVCRLLLEKKKKIETRNVINGQLLSKVE